jgi:hypothetical protein
LCESDLTTVNSCNNSLIENGKRYRTKDEMEEYKKVKMVTCSDILEFRILEYKIQSRN